MTSGIFDHEPEGATPLENDEAADLIAQHIQTREALNLWEQQNILNAADWYQRRRRHSILTVDGARQLHRRMFDETWAWAGHYRRTNKNIGVPWYSITEEVHKLVADAAYWIANSTLSLDEIAVRVHHRLVEIHPFPNGNGRHARLFVDILLQENGRPPFRWKNQDLEKAGRARSEYIGALRRADDGDYGPLRDLLLVDRQG